MAEPIGIGGGNVQIDSEIADLVAFSGRGPGTDAERRAALHVAERLRALGREARIEPTRVHPAFGLGQLLNIALGVAGSVLAVQTPVAGLALVLVAAGSAFGDLTGTFFLARVPFGIRASQNVVSEEDTGKPGRLILVARYNSARGGSLFGRRLRHWPSLVFWSLMLVLACATARLAGVDATWLTAVQYVPTVVLIALTPLFAGVALAPLDDGANRNASGVATALALAERYGGALEHFDLTVLLTGAAHPAPLGMRAWVRRHRGDLDPDATVVVCIEPAGHGTPHYATAEGLLFPARLNPTLTSICADLESATPYVAREMSDAYAARAAGLPAVRIASLGAPESNGPVDPDALARTYDFAAGLLERIDEKIGPGLA